jgi:hypothetical protein
MDPTTNPLAGPGAGQDHPILAAAQSNVDQSMAQYKKLTQAQKSAKLVRSELDGLTKLGEAITGDDVVEALGKMVAGGLSPEPLIAMMAGDASKGQAPMPESGSALASWVQQHEQQFAQIEQQIEQAHSQAAHSVGVAGVQGLIAHHIEAARRGAPLAGAPQGPSAPNPILH